MYTVYYSKDIKNIIKVKEQVFMQMVVSVKTREVKGRVIRESLEMIERLHIPKVKRAGLFFKNISFLRILAC